ncbi:hypothetical protein [Runella aurantiaca]|uniref:Fibronectin type-III domain-containing protein n=1 Tax=Runella aurantiaca TaxID=2282308 RepID=A0A369IAU6_9BACT|nr:hypothetical protein [Runella aurantiaca]RDB06758.1 hypothetical protein DVG78_05555 [Runella aurantiaca]
MKTFSLFYWTILVGLAFACEPALINEETAPLETLKLLSVTPDFAKNSVTIQGEISVNTDVQFGIVYGTTAKPTVGSQQVPLQSSGTTLSGTISNLKAGQRYYFRLYSKKGSDVLYSNERSVVLSTGWRQLASLKFDGQPLPYGWMSESYGGLGISVFTRTNLASESTGQQWNYFGSGEWQANRSGTTSLPARYNPIYLPYSDQTTYFFGGGYYYSPEPSPTYTYQKFFDDYRDGAALDYPGGDVPTVQFAIGANLPDLYVLEVGNQYRLWKYQNRTTPTGWDLVSGAEFPQKSLKKLLAFTAGEKGFILSEEEGSLWAFDPNKNQWTVRKNTPFKGRQRGSAISMTKGGVYGLGIDVKTGEGYRDLWLYDDKADTWSYLTDYPGEGSANVTAVGRNNRVGFMMGYRATTTAIGTAEFSVAKDAWVYEVK